MRLLRPCGSTPDGDKRKSGRGGGTTGAGEDTACIVVGAAESRGCARAYEECRGTLGELGRTGKGAGAGVGDEEEPRVVLIPGLAGPTTASKASHAKAAAPAPAGPHRIWSRPREPHLGHSHFWCCQWLIRRQLAKRSSRGGPCHDARMLVRCGS